MESKKKLETVTEITAYKKAEFAHLNCQIRIKKDKLSFYVHTIGVGPIEKVAVYRAIQSFGIIGVGPIEKVAIQSNPYCAVPLSKICVPVI